MNTYPKYKDSGEQWLGQIPAHWEIRKSKYVWREKNAVSSTGNEQLLSVSQYEGVRPSNESSRSESCKGYKIVEKDDLVINIMLAWLGGLGVSNYEGIVSPAYCIYKPLIDVNTKYLHYLYKTPMYLAEFARHSTGVVPSRWRMYTDDFGQVLTVLPPKEEQEAMVAYLDEQTGKLDQAIAREQKMIDLLEERKQIIIQHAVTKGLNTNAKMKDSGIEWIGEMPEHWDLTRLKRFVKFISGFAFNSNSFSDSGVRVIRIGDISKSIDFENCARSNQRSAKLEQFRIRENDILIAMSGATTGKCCIAENVVEAYINQRVGIIRCAKPRFIYYALKTKLFSEYVNITNAGSAQPNISSSGICNYPLVMPTDEEQNQIVIYLDKHIANVDRAIEAREKMIALLQERKQIIINEVVTGKIKVL